MDKITLSLAAAAFALAGLAATATQPPNYVGRSNDVVENNVGGSRHHTKDSLPKTPLIHLTGAFVESTITPLMKEYNHRRPNSSLTNSYGEFLSAIEQLKLRIAAGEQVDRVEVVLDIHSWINKHGEPISRITTNGIPVITKVSELLHELSPLGKPLDIFMIGCHLGDPLKVQLQTNIDGLADKVPNGSRIMTSSNKHLTWATNATFSDTRELPNMFIGKVSYGYGINNDTKQDAGGVTQNPYVKSLIEGDNHPLIYNSPMVMEKKSTGEWHYLSLETMLTEASKKPEDGTYKAFSNFLNAKTSTEALKYLGTFYRSLSGLIGGYIDHMHTYAASTPMPINPAQTRQQSQVFMIEAILQKQLGKEAQPFSGFDHLSRAAKENIRIAGYGIPTSKQQDIGSVLEMLQKEPQRNSTKKH
jgi:hypothetical protein